MLNLPPLQAVQERDIDLLLVEELTVRTAFSRWFIDQATQESVSSLVGVWHSVWDSRFGESDLVIVFEGAKGERFALLVENKIDASPQPAQAARYRERGQLGIAQGWWERFWTCLIAPERYLSQTQEAQAYDDRVTYEAIRDWLHQYAASDPRARFRAAVFDLAIEEARRGYEMIPNPDVTRFMNAYAEFIEEHFPDLEAPPRRERPAGGYWPLLAASQLPTNIWLIHKLVQGHVDLQLVGMASDLAELRRRYEPFLDATMRIQAVGKSAAIRSLVPKVDPRRPFASQEAEIASGLEAAQRILGVFQKARAFHEDKRPSDEEQGTAKGGPNRQMSKALYYLGEAVCRFPSGWGLCFRQRTRTRGTDPERGAPQGRGGRGGPPVGGARRTRALGGAGAEGRPPGPRATPPARRPALGAGSRAATSSSSG